MNKEPTISVIMTFFNAHGTIEKSIISILNQSFTDFELLLVDDGSTDNTMDSLKVFNDDRLILIRGGRIGRAAALNLGLRRAKGKYIAILDADDMALQNRFAEQKQYLDINKDICLVCSSVELLDEFGNHTGISEVPVEHAKLLKRLLNLNPFAHSSVMYRRQEAIEVGGYNERCEKSIDFNFYLDLINAGGQINGQHQIYTQLRYYPNSWGKSDTQALQMYYGILGLVDYYLIINGKERLLRGQDLDWKKVKPVYKIWFEKKGYRRRFEAKKIVNEAKESLFSGNIMRFIRLLILAFILDPFLLCYRGIGFVYLRDTKNFVDQIKNS